MLIARFQAPDRAVLRAVFLTLLILIAPNWLLTRDLADGAVISFARAIGNSDGLFLWLSNSNWQLAIVFYKIMFALSDWSGLTYLFFVKCALSLLLVALYFECWRLARDVFMLSPNHAALAAIFCVASPSLYTLTNSASTVNLLCLWLVLLGHRLFWHEKITVCFSGLLLLVISFQVNSNLVFALALDIVFLWVFKCRRKERLAWFIGLFMTTVCVYAVMRVISPPQRLFVEYNQLLNPFNSDSLLRMLRATAMFLTWGTLPLLALISVALISPIFKYQDAKKKIAEMQAKSYVPTILLLLFLAIAAAFPYIIVGKGPPLFTPTIYGNGLTEQVLRAAYPGPIAPTWANTSGRHGLLLSVPMGLLTWFLATWLAEKLKMRWRPLGLYALLLPLAFIWILPAYGNKLQNQWAEISLVKGFKTLQPPKAGIVELRYKPISSWLIWTTHANMILREAWGYSHYLGFFYSLDTYKQDLLWHYHSQVLNDDALQSRLQQNALALDGFPGSDCYTKYEGVWPPAPLFQSMLAGWFPALVPTADIKLVSSDCELKRKLVNPKPDKKMIL